MENAKHYRQSIRLQDYDYSSAGAYFVTICAYNKECLFGNIVGGKMQLNEAGEMICNWWKETENKFDNIVMDEYIVMPNHFHGIVLIKNNVGAILCNRPNTNNKTPNINNKNTDANVGGNIKKGENIVSPLRISNSYNGLGYYISWFKRMAVNEYIRGVKCGKFLPFEKFIWQRNYYEHVIRDENDLNRVREYIQNNPLQWEMDENNPNKMAVEDGAK